MGSSTEGSQNKGLGLGLVGVGLALMLTVFYFAVAAYLSVQNVEKFKSTFGGALSYLQTSASANSTLGALGAYADLIIVILIMVVFLSIALAAGSIILGKGVELLRGSK
ncbi:hypothetical protein [Acidilobus saccharovorans]|nr:hypothetical protein [Acidilobus saccharovorans]